MRVLVRADGGPGVGAGHLMRQLALAEAFGAAGAPVALATAAPETPLLLPWRERGLRVHAVPAPAGCPGDAEETARLAREASAGLLVLDCYALGDAYRRAVTGAARTLAAYDDEGRDDPGVDVVVNPNPGAEQCRYPVSRRSLLGCAYVALRAAVRRLDGAPQRGSGRRVLVTFGGDDVNDLGATLAEELAAAGLEVIRPAGGFAELAPALAACDVVLTAGGLTALEAAFLGRAAVLWPQADNQRPGARALQRTGAAVLAADRAEAVAWAARLSADAAARRALGAAGRRLIDGGGADRLAAALAPGPPS